MVCNVYVVGNSQVSALEVERLDRSVEGWTVFPYCRRKEYRTHSASSSAVVGEFVETLLLEIENAIYLLF